MTDDLKEKLANLFPKNKPVDLWGVEWIQKAQKVLETTAMTTAQHSQFSMMIARNASIIYTAERGRKFAVDNAVKRRQEIEAQAHEELREIANHLIVIGIEIPAISKITGLSKREITLMHIDFIVSLTE